MGKEHFVTNLKDQGGLDMPSVLEALQGYLQQLQSSSDPDPIRFRPTLVQDIAAAAQAAREELECRLLPNNSTTEADKP